MIFKLTIDLNNAAFYDAESGDFRPEPEIIMLLALVQDKLAAKEPGATVYDTLLDSNGNPIGSYKIAVERA